MGRNQRDETTIIGVREGLAKIGNNAGSLTAANGTENCSVTNVAPAGVGTATISKWLLMNIDGADYYIPMWT